MTDITLTEKLDPRKYPYRVVSASKWARDWVFSAHTTEGAARKALGTAIRAAGSRGWQLIKLEVLDEYRPRKAK